MPPQRALRSEVPARAALGAAALLAVLHGCAAADRSARQDVESLQTNVQQLESNVQARQAGVYEQIRELREEQNRQERLLEEGSRQTKTVGQQVDRLRERTQEELDARDKAQRESSLATGEHISRLGARLDGLQTDLQKGFQTLNDNLLAMSTFEKKQEDRIAKIQEQFQSQLKVVIEEVGQENQALTRAVASVRADLDAARQESAANRQGLLDLQGAMQQIAERLAAAQRQIEESARRLEAARKAAPARDGQQTVRGGEHTVRSGETLTTIASRYGTSVQAIMEKNRITNANSIREGQKLTIPEP